MPYKDEFLKKLKVVKDYKKLWETDLEKACKFPTALKALEAVHQTGQFMRYISNSPALFGGKDKQSAFFLRYPELFPKGRFPSISMDNELGIISIEDVDYEKLMEAVEEEFKDNPEAIEKVFKKADPNIRGINHPLTDLVNNIKKDVDNLYPEEEANKELKQVLDFANEEIVEKTGQNLVDNAVDINSNLRNMQGNRGFTDFVKKAGMDPKEITNRTKGKASFSPGLYNNRENFEKYKPFLDMGVKFDEDYKKKVLELDRLCQEEGLLTNAMGGESGSKEYGLADYFQKNYKLKIALTDYAKITDEEQKKAALANIKNLAGEVKEVTAKYEKVFDFIEKNFDLENVTLSGNVYSGRPAYVDHGDIVNWKPNLPPKFDFEKSPAVVFLSGFTQLKAAAKAGDVSLEEYLDEPMQTFMKTAKKFGEDEDKKIYLPRSEENTLGKRMAHVFYHSSQAYNVLPGIGMMGGRGLEFLCNTSPKDENTLDNIIKCGIVKEYTPLYNHSPDVHFGSYFMPDVDKMKFVFAAGDQVDELYKVSPNYVNENCKIDPLYKDYASAVKSNGNTPIEEEYRRIMKAMKDCFEEEEEMSNHPDIYLRSEKDTMSHYSYGTLIAAGRQYFMDYLRENNLSLTSVENEELRQEMTNFINDPVHTFNDHHYAFPEDGIETLEKVEAKFEAYWRDEVEGRNEAFMEKFNENNHKPNGYNAGKDIPTILQDNRGSWWERWRGTTSKQYLALKAASENALDEDSPTCGDKENLYICAKAYKAYKLPEGRSFNSLSKTAKRRVEYCDSIINAYEQEKAAREAANNPQPVAQNNNNNIINQNEFQNQLQNDLGPKEVKEAKVEVIKEEAAEKDPPEDSATV